MRIFACTRNIPIGGSANAPVYALQTVFVKAPSGPEAAVAVSDYQAEEKIRLFGRATHAT